MRMIADGIALSASESISIETAAARIVDQSRANRTRMPGLGHRVHRTCDPRVEVLFSMAREGEGADEGPGVRFMRALQAAARERIRALPINIDGALAAVLHDLEFPPQAGMFMFIIGRVAGLTAEVAEEYAREKPMRVRIPVEYDGEEPTS